MLRYELTGVRRPRMAACDWRKQSSKRKVLHIGNLQTAILRNRVKARPVGRENPEGGGDEGRNGKRPSRSTPQCARRKALQKQEPETAGKATKGGDKLLPIFSPAPAWGGGFAPRQRALERADDCTAKHRVCASRGVEIMTCSRPLIRTRPAVAGLRPVCDQRHRILFSPVPADCSVV